MENMIYPGLHSTAKVETFFVEGIQINICEVAPSHYEYLICSHPGKKPAGRYFMEVEGLVVNYAHAKELHSKIGQCRWDLFCADRAFFMVKVKEVEQLLATVASITSRIEQKPATRGMIEPKLIAAKKRLLDHYGIKA